MLEFPFDVEVLNSIGAISQSNQPASFQPLLQLFPPKACPATACVYVLVLIFLLMPSNVSIFSFHRLLSAFLRLLFPFMH